MTNIVHGDIRFTLFGCFALSAEQKDPVGGVIRLTLEIAILEALVFNALGFLEERWEGGEACDYDGCLRSEA